jgi:hypothetical protein
MHALAKRRVLVVQFPLASVDIQLASHRYRLWLSKPNV